MIKKMRMREGVLARDCKRGGGGDGMSSLFRPVSGWVTLHREEDGN